MFKFPQWGILWVPASKALSCSAKTELDADGRKKEVPGKQLTVWWSPQKLEPTFANFCSIPFLVIK